MPITPPTRLFSMDTVVITVLPESTLKEYENHVLDEPLRSKTGKQVSLCGEPISGFWHFQGVGHAFSTRQREGRLMVCPGCLSVIKRVFES